MWQKYKIEEGKIFTSKIGHSQFWIEKQNKIWHVAKLKDQDPEQSNRPLTEVDSLPDGVDWSYHVADKHNMLQIAPSSPDRPIIVKPKKTFTVLPNMSLDIYIKVPIWLQLYASSVKPENLILEFPSQELSSTWFGAPDNGELAYSLIDEIIFDLKEEKLEAYSAICPIEIRNESETSLDFQRLSVPVDQLNIYSNSAVLCTNEVKVKFKGEEKSSEVHISAGSPPIFEGLKQINKARNSSSDNILKKSFSFIKSFTEY